MTNNNKPLISIIVPVYNVSPYLVKAINSLRVQSMQNIEIICVDDCSTDNSLEILRKFIGIDPRIKLLAHEKNYGVSCARNTALKIAKADYIMFLDPDDYTSPNFCETMYKAINESDYDLAVCNVNIEISPSMNGRNRGYTNDKNYANIKTSWVWNKIWKKSLMDKYEVKFPEGILGEDACFKNCYYIISNQKVNIINEKLYTYLIRIDSLMSAFDTLDNPVVFDCFAVAENTYNFYKKHNKLNEIYQHYFKSLGIAFKFLTEKNYNKIAEVMKKSLETKPEFKIYNYGLEVNNMKCEVPKEIIEKILSLRKNF